MASSLCISLSTIQDRKTVKGSEIFEFRAEQNYTFRSLFVVISELQGIDTAVRKTLFSLFCMKKTQSALIITSES